MQAEFRALYPFTTVSASAFSEAYLQIGNVTIEHDQIDAVADSTEVDRDIVSDCFEIAKRIKALIPLFICRSHPLLQGIRRIQSIFFVPNQNQKRVFITLYESAGESTDEKNRAIRILHSIMLLFDAQGTFQQKVDTVSFLTNHAPTDSREMSRSQQKVILRLSNTQTLGRSEHFPECFAFIDYPGKKGGRKIVYFQKRAFCNLETYLERNSHVFAQENSELVMLIIARKILRALITMHQKGLLHKDLKCENVLLDEAPEYTANREPVVQITDFDRSCKLIDINGLQRVEGTADWMAPEVLRRACRMQGIEQEIWSTGLVLHMLTGADGKAEVHKLQGMKNDHYYEFLDLLKKRAGIEQALKSTPTIDLQQQLAEVNRHSDELKQMLEKEEEKWLRTIDALSWPDKIQNLRHVAERMIQKDPQMRISFETALTEVENLINLKKIDSLQIQKA